MSRQFWTRWTEHEYLFAQLPETLLDWKALASMTQCLEMSSNLGLCRKQLSAHKLVFIHNI